MRRALSAAARAGEGGARDPDGLDARPRDPPSTSMQAWLLLVDLGNTSASAAAVELGTGAFRPLLRARSVDDLAARLADGAAGIDLAGAAATYASSVARPARRAALDDALVALGGAPAAFHPPSGLELAIESPATLGFDRQYAARAAVSIGRRPAVVVDAGTALTVDAVTPPEAEVAGAPGAVAQENPSRGTFLGGAIAPGPSLAMEALARGGAQLYEVDLPVDPPALGTHTRAAIRAGVVHGVAGSALHLAERVAAEARLSGADVWLTGGAAPLVRGALAQAFGARLREEPWLVLEGLALAAREAHERR